MAPSMLHIYKKHNDVFIDYEDDKFNEYYTDHKNWSSRVLSYLKLIQSLRITYDKTIVVHDMLEFICKTFHNVNFGNENDKNKLTVTMSDKIKDLYYQHNLQTMNEYHYRLFGEYIK